MKTRKMLIAAEPGGEWLVLRVHSLVTPDGWRWDADNGWTGRYSQTPGEVEILQEIDE